jgi:hypothetical protein
MRKALAWVISVHLFAGASSCFAEDSGPDANKPHEGPCSGDSCARISFYSADKCVWARNGSDRAIRLEIRLADEVLAVTMEAADAAKARDEERKEKEAKFALDDCLARERQRVAFLKKLEDMRQAGVQVPNIPEIAAKARDCYAQPVARKGSPDGTAGSADQLGVHRLEFQPAFAEYLPFYDVRLATPKGCVASRDEVLSYAANSIEVPADQREPQPNAAEAASPTAEACKAEITAAMLKLQSVGGVRLNVTEPHSRSTLDFAPPDRMYEKTKSTESDGPPTETIAISGRAWRRTGANWEELPPEIAKSTLLRTNEVYFELPKDAGEFNCLGTVSYEGSSRTEYQSAPYKAPESLYEGMSDDMKRARSELIRISEIYLDPATGLPAVNDVQEGRGPGRTYLVFHANYSYPKDIVIEPPLD